MSFMLAYTAADWQQKEATELALNKRSIIRVLLPKPFPQLFLDSNKNDKSLVSAVPTSFKADQKLTLEGSFNEYFDFYAPVDCR